MKSRKIIIDTNDILEFRGLAENVSRAQESLIINSDKLVAIRNEISLLEERVEELRSLEQEFYARVQEKYSFEDLHEAQRSFLSNLI